MAPSSGKASSGGKVQSVSVFDVLIGGGRTIRQAKKKAAQKAKAAEAESSKEAEKTEKAKEPEPAKESQEPAGWTSTQDEDLLKYKSENKTWKEIASLLDKKDYECKHRFKEIRPADPAKSEKVTEPNTSKAYELKKKDKRAAAKNEHESQHTTDSRLPGDLSGLKTEDAIKILENLTKNEFTREELIIMFRAAREHDRNKWNEVASRFYDQTGRVIEEERVKELLG